MPDARGEDGRPDSRGEARIGLAGAGGSQSLVIGRHGQRDHRIVLHPGGYSSSKASIRERVTRKPYGGLLGTCRAAYSARMGETDRQRRAREASHQYFTEALARMFDPESHLRTVGPPTCHAASTCPR